MKIEYFSDTDSLYIDLSEKTSAESKEVAEGVVIDYEEDGNIVGIDIDQAPKKIDLNQLKLEHMPFKTEVLSA